MSVIQRGIPSTTVKWDTSVQGIRPNKLALLRIGVDGGRAIAVRFAFRESGIDLGADER
jgi:hypothetical protein